MQDYFAREREERVKFRTEVLTCLEFVSLDCCAKQAVLDATAFEFRDYLE